jgi:hypothetical protein
VLELFKEKFGVHYDWSRVSKEENDLRSKGGLYYIVRTLAFSMVRWEPLVEQTGCSVENR